jgi:hypothetical protein
MEIKINKSKEKDYVFVYNKKYYSKNKENILSKMMETIICNNCNKTISKCHEKRHQRSKKCLLKAEPDKTMEQLENN